MNINEFWDLIERVKDEGGSDIEDREEALSTKLNELDSDEIISFSQIFSELVDSAYSWKLWGAAYLMQGGCGDDSFWDFRNSLISIGRDAFESALKNPDSLCELGHSEPENLYHEGFQYVAQQVFEEKTGEEMPLHERERPQEPLGEEWDFDDEEETKGRLPRLHAKCENQG